MDESKKTTFSPTVYIPDLRITVTPPGWMWIMGFAIKGCKWAMDQVTDPEFDKTVKLWFAEQKMLEVKEVLDKIQLEYDQALAKFNSLKEKL